MDIPESRPLDALFRPNALIAVILAGEALAMILALAPGQPPGGRLIQFGLASMGIQWIALGTLCAIYLSQRPLSKLAPTVVAWTCLGLLLCMTALVSVAASRLPGIVGDTPGAALAFVWRMLALALVVGLLGLVTFQNYWSATRLAVLAKQAELDALRARIQPHFLFNTLNTAAALVRQRPADAEQLLLDLADLFRAALAGPRTSSLEQELTLARRYLQIEALRFGGRLQVEWDLPQPLPPLMLPTLSIQPLVENAIRYGVEPSPQGGWIRIRVQANPSSLEISIRNSLPAQGRNTPGHGVGLKAVTARIEEFSGGQGSVRTTADAEGFMATISLPLEATAG